VNLTAVSKYAGSPPPSSLRLLGRVAGQAWQHTRTGLTVGVRALCGASRLPGERAVLEELFAIPAFAQLMAAQPQADPLFFVRHRYFLSREFGAAERLASVLDHFHFEQTHFSPALLTALHRDGLRLWRHDAGYEIRLRANAGSRHEGPLSLVLRRGSLTVHEIAFAWVDAQLLGAGTGCGPVLFVTRNQPLPAEAPELARFRADFPQNQPPCFVLAALNGVAAALGQQRIVGVRDACQIAFEPDHLERFKRCYDRFWHGFGGRSVGRHGLEMQVPAALAPLEELQPKHRARARLRREHWRQMAEVAEAALSPYLRR
jgi:uncharacterized protein VirK/YbjX